VCQFAFQPSFASKCATASPSIANNPNAERAATPVAQAFRPEAFSWVSPAFVTVQHCWPLSQQRIIPTACLRCATRRLDLLSRLFPAISDLRLAPLVLN